MRNFGAGQLSEAVLSTTDLIKRYGSKEVVRSVSLEVRPSEVVGLLGPNGAGKTTTFNMIAGSIRPTVGQVFLGEDEITELPMYRRARLGITYLPQEASIFRKLSVADNVNAILETVEPGAIRCRAASAGGWRSHARWCWTRSSCCWTSPLRASTRSP
jgi:ABC-type lipopolysaccharide export system ATPase subunit